MAENAAQIAERLGLDTSQTVGEATGATPAAGAGEPQGTPTPGSPAGAQNTDTGNGGDPGPIPYSRFAEVNGRYQELKQYEQLKEYGIEPDSAVRLASFEAAYQQDPTGTISAMVDTLDLPDGNKAALKALLDLQTPAATAPAQGAANGAMAATELPAEVKEVVDWVKQQRTQAEATESQARLDHVVSHWKTRDTEDGIVVPERQRLLYIQQAAANNLGNFKTLEELSDAARTAFLEDRDALLGGAIQRRGPGLPLAVPAGGVVPTGAVVPKSMAEARKLIEADIARGAFPDMQPGGGG